MRRTTQTHFYKANRHLDFRHPSRRFLYHKIGAGLTVAAGAYVYGSYSYAAAGEPDTSRFAAVGLLEAMQFLPANLLSRWWGYWAAEDIVVPQWVHQRLIDTLVSMYDIDLSEFETTDFRTSQAFFTRKLKDQARPIAAGADVVSPADAEVISVAEVTSEGNLVQVKGCEYPVGALLRCTLPDVRDDMKRMAMVLHLRPGDYHRVHSPMKWRATRTAHVPGLLYPVTRAATQWIPHLYVGNERIAVTGERADGRGTMSMALVGATCVGKIKLAFDERFVTNLRDAPEFSMSFNYTKPPALAAGDEVGSFEWGSSVVMVVDIPKTKTVLVERGAEVKVGQALVQ